MSRRTFEDMDAEVLLRMANRSDITDDQRAQFLNDAQLWAALTYEHPEIEEVEDGTVLAGTDVVTGITGMWFPTVVKNVTDARQMTPGDKYIIEHGTKVAGAPTRWYMWKNALYVDRKPSADTTIRVWYIGELPELVPGATSALNRAFDIVLIMKAAEIGLSTVRDFKNAHIQSVALDNYVSEWKLPKREARKPSELSGVRPRLR